MIPRHPSFILPLVAALAIAVPAAAKPADPMTKQQEAQIAAVLKANNDQVIAAFKGEDALRANLERELKGIQAQRDPRAKKAAILAFQAKYASAYRAVLAKGKINLAALASQLNSIYPAFAFQVRDGTYLAGVSLNSDAGASSPAATTPTVLTPRSSDYTFTKDVDCAAIGGGDVSYSNGQIVGEAFAAKLGGCASKGDMRYAFQVPAGQKAQVDVSGSVSGYAGAIAVAGGSLGSASASITAGGQGVSTSCSALAPGWWAAWEECAIENARVTPLITGTGQFQLVGTSSSKTITGAVVVSGTLAGAEVKISGARITIGPN